MIEPITLPEQAIDLTNNPVDQVMPQEVQDDSSFIPEIQEPVAQEEQLDFVPEKNDVDTTPVPYSYDDAKFLAQQAAIANDNTNLAQALIDYEPIIGSYNRQIMMGQEDQIRKDISIKSAQRESEQLMQLTRDAFEQGERDPNFLLDSIRLVRQLRDDQDRTALEQKAVDRLVDFANSNPEWSMLQLEQPTIMENVYNDLEKELIIANEVARWRAIGDNQDSFFINDLLQDAPEVLGTLGIQSVFAKYKAAGGFRVGALLREKGNKIRALPKDQIVPAIRELVSEFADASSWFREQNPDMVNEFIENAFYATDESALNTTGGFVLESLMTIAGLGALKGVFKGSKAISALMKTGNTESVARDIVNVLNTKNINNASVVSSVEEAARNAIALRLPEDVMMGVPGKVRDQLTKQERITARVKSLYNVERLTDEELATAVQRETAYVNSIYDEGSILDISHHYNVDKNLYELHYNIGKESGLPYASKELAEEGMKLRDIQGEVFQYEDGGWYIRGVREIPEEGIIQGIPDLGETPTGFIKRTIQDQRSIVSKLLGSKGTASVQNDARLSSIVTKIYNEGIGKLGKNDFKAFNEITDIGLKQEKWFSPTELEDMLIAKGYQKGTKSYDNVVTAYYTGRQISDTAFFLSNRDIYTNAARRGLQEIEIVDTGIIDEVTGEITTFPFNGKEIRDLGRFKGNWDRQVIYDMDKKEFIKGNKEYIKEALSKGKTVVQPEDATFTREAFGTPATIIVGSRNSIKIKDLSYQQLGYTPGGRRTYRNVFFVGQTRKGTWPENLGGGSYALRPKTLFAAPTRKQAERFTNSLDRSIKAFDDYTAGRITAASANNIIKESFDNFPRWRIKTVDDFQNFIDDVDLDISTPLHVRGDRETPPLDNADSALFDIESGYDFQASTGNRFNTGRGEQLFDIYGKEAETLSFSEAMRKSVDLAIKSGVYNDVRVSAVERFAQEFGKKDIMTFADNASPYEIVTQGVIKKELAKTRPKVYERAKATQFYINTLLKTESTWDAKLANATMRFADWVEGTNLPLASKAAQKIAEKGKIDPIAKLRSYNFNLSLGLFAPQQLLLQAQSMVTAISLDPIRGMKAAKALPFFRYALHQTEKDFDNLMAAKGWKLSGFKSQEDMYQAIEQFRNIGANDFGSTIGQIDAVNSLGMGTNWTLNKASRINEAGKVFFNNGERLGRITAYEIARRRWVDNVGNVNPNGLHFTDKKAADWIRDEYNRITLSPNASDNPLFTKGLASLPTQFWSYQSKLINAMLPKIGSRNYTTAEKMKLIGGHALFYGAGAVPLFNAISDKFFQETGTEMDQTTYKYLMNGIIDGTIYAVSDGQLDTDFASTASIGGFFDMMMENFSENPVSELIGGASLSNFHRGFTAMSDVAKMYKLWDEPKLETITMMGYEFLKNVVSTERNRTKAMLAWNTGMLIDKDGNKLANINKGEAALMLFGIPPAEMNKTFKKYDALRMTQEDINDQARILNKLHNAWKLAKTDAERETIQQAISLHAASMNSTGYGDKIAQRVFQLQKRIPFAESVDRRYLENAMRNPRSVNLNDLPPEMKQIKESIFKGLTQDGNE